MVAQRECVHEMCVAEQSVCLSYLSNPLPSRCASPGACALLYTSQLKCTSNLKPSCLLSSTGPAGVCAEGVPYEGVAGCYGTTPRSLPPSYPPAFVLPTLTRIVHLGVIQ